MKRLSIGITVLVILLSSGSLAAICMDHFHRPISHELTQAVAAMEGGHWEQATTLANNAHSQWLHCRDFTAAFADHDVLEEIDALFAEIHVFAAAGDPISFSAACAHLSELTKAVAESHHPKWQNLL